MAKAKAIKRVSSIDDVPNDSYEISALQANALSKKGFQCFVVKRSDGKDEYFTGWNV